MLKNKAPIKKKHSLSNKYNLFFGKYKYSLGTCLIPIKYIKR